MQTPQSKLDRLIIFIDKLSSEGKIDFPPKFIIRAFQKFDMTLLEVLAMHWLKIVSKIAKEISITHNSSENMREIGKIYSAFIGN